VFITTAGRELRKRNAREGRTCRTRREEEKMKKGIEISWGKVTFRKNNLFLGNEGMRRGGDKGEITKRDRAVKGSPFPSNRKKIA